MSDDDHQHVSRLSLLERRCRLLFGFTLLVAISGGFVWYGQQTEKLILQQDRAKGRLLVDNLLLVTHWENWETSAEMLDLIRNQRSNLEHHKYAWKFLRANGLNSESQSFDSLELQILATYLQSPPRADAESNAFAQYFERALTDEQGYEYYQPIYATSGMCVGCHRQQVGQPNLNQNDLMAVVKVQFPNDETHREKSRNGALLTTAWLVTVTLAIAVSFILIRYVVFKPLERQQGPADELR